MAVKDFKSVNPWTQPGMIQVGLRLNSQLQISRDLGVRQ